jgi:hypothetical protein
MSDTTDLSQTIAAQPEVVSCELGGGAALLDMRSGHYFGLNPVAARIWGHLAQPVTAATILDDLLATYDVTREQAEADLIRTLGKLKEAGLIHVGAETPR